MAIQNARILIRRGNEVDFDANNMQPGEWALSTDEKIVRICVAPGVCIRMATYDAFETDMAKIEAILEQAKSIKEAVTLINTEVSENAKAVAEYTEQAKQYRDEAEQFRNEAEAFAPEGYSELVQNVEENTVKIETILEKGGLTFDESASGENIHLTDTTDNKVTAFALYGKATQNTTTGKQLLDLKNNTTYVGAVISYENEGEIITVKGTAPHCLANYILPTGKFAGKTITFKAKKITKSNSSVKTFVGLSISKASDSVVTYQKITSSSLSNTVSIPSDVTKLEFHIKPNDSNTTLSTESILTVEELMVSENKDDTWEPYTNGASPNPDYPQEINIAGSDGSVGVVSCGKNLLKNTATTQTVNGVTFTVNEDGSVTANGTASATGSILLSKELGLEVGEEYVLSGSPQGSSATTYRLQIWYNNVGACALEYGDGKKFIPTDDINNSNLAIYMVNGAIFNNVTFYPMIRLASITDDTYEPYKETVSTIPTPNGLPGIPVSSGGNYTDENGQQWICDSIVKYADGTGKYVQRVGKEVFDGSEEWQYDATVVSRFHTVETIPNATVKSSRTPLLCSHGIFRSVGDENGTTFTHSGFFYLYNGQFTSSNDFKTWLASNNVTIYYELAEPIITDLSAEEIAEIEKLQTFYPVTNISNDADCYMEVAYKADAKNYIDNIILSRVATLETAVINNL